MEAIGSYTSEGVGVPDHSAYRRGQRHAISTGSHFRVRYPKQHIPQGIWHSSSPTGLSPLAPSAGVRGHFDRQPLSRRLLLSPEQDHDARALFHNEDHRWKGLLSPAGPSRMPSPADAFWYIQQWAQDPDVWQFQNRCHTGQPIHTAISGRAHVHGLCLIISMMGQK